ncbi:unnamed protein product [Calypogeia fissa]
MVLLGHCARGRGIQKGPPSNGPGAERSRGQHKRSSRVGGKPLQFSNPALAHAIAAEWEWQDSNGFCSYTMPLMKLASISIDQVRKDRERIIVTLLKYCHTYALCCRASPDKKAGLTVARALESLKSCQTAAQCCIQSKKTKHWDPLLDWVEVEIGARPVVSSSIFGPSQPEDVVHPSNIVDDWGYVSKFKLGV